ncbi:MAG: AMP-binding protein, partial [Actinobacteria bacterium]|nr:AMP-binding protein [Actinomycetota bacterium]
MTVNIGAFLAKRAMLNPDSEALVCEDVRRTFSECNSRTNKFVHAMQKLGIGHGDRVAILALNEPEYLDMFFGLGKIGAILVPINYRLAGPEVQYILSDSESSVLVFGKEYIETIDSIRNDVPAREFIAITDDPPGWAKSYESVIKDEPESEPDINGGDDDVLSILYTSGTTGRPKGAMLTHKNYFCTSVNIFTTVGWTGETALVALPLFHIGGLAQAPIWAHQGVRAVLLRSLDPQRFLAHPGGKSDRLWLGPRASADPETRSRLRKVRLGFHQGPAGIRCAFACDDAQGIRRGGHRGPQPLRPHRIHGIGHGDRLRAFDAQSRVVR